jgi:hypothetical protein
MELRNKSNYDTLNNMDDFNGIKQNKKVYSHDSIYKIFYKDETRDRAVVKGAR